jgi:hypothetical protein
MAACQWPDQQFHGGWSMVHSDADYGSRAADGFVHAEARQIVQLRWWGAYESTLGFGDCDPIPDDGFLITIYDDAGFAPGRTLLEQTGAKVSRYATGRTITLVHEHDEYMYTYDLPQPLEIPAGHRYWIEIVSQSSDQCAWSWETAPQGDAGDGSSFWQAHAKNYERQAFDLALCIEPFQDCNGNGIGDPVDIINGDSIDCDRNGIPDECEVTNPWCHDVNCNGLADYCEPVEVTDCNGNGLRDACDLSCGAPGGRCDVAGCGDAADCNRNCRPDVCDVASSVGFPGGLCRIEPCSGDGNQNGLPDECEDTCLSGHGDGELDCDADLRDFLFLQRCFTAAGGPIVPQLYASFASNPGDCDCFDVDFDGDIDAIDFTHYLSLLLGNQSICDICPDVWSTSIGQDVSFYDFASTPIPAGFFGDDSEPFDRIVPLMGVRSGAPEIAYYESPEQFDTQVIHPRPVFEQPLYPCHQFDTVPIRVRALTLVGREPILIESQPATEDCNENGYPDHDELGPDCGLLPGGCAVDDNQDGVPDNCQRWMVHATLSEVQPRPGYLHARTTHANGGVFSTDFVLQPTFHFFLLQDLLDFKPVEDVRTVTLDTGRENLPPMIMTFENLPWSQFVDLQAHPALVMDCANGEFVPGYVPEGVAQAFGDPPETTCASHIGEDEVHHFCPPECEPPAACHYEAVAEAVSVPPGACPCDAYDDQLPDEVWTGQCKTDEDCVPVMPPLTINCNLDPPAVCRRLYVLSNVKPCAEPPPCP